MKPKKLPYKTFLATFRLVPRVAVDLLIVGNKKGFLLIKRKRTPCVGFWHLPGGFVLKDELLEECIKRITKEEIRTEIKNWQFAGVFDDLQGDPRGHIIHLVYKCVLAKPVEQIEDVKFFKKWPAKIAFNQQKILAELGFKGVKCYSTR